MIKMNNQDLTLLSEGQIWGNDKESKLEVIRKYGTKAAITDLCVLTGSYLCGDTYYNIDEDSSLKGRASWFWTRSYDGDNNVRAVNWIGLDLMMAIIMSARSIGLVVGTTNIATFAVVLFAQLCNLL